MGWIEGLNQARQSRKNLAPPRQTLSGGNGGIMYVSIYTLSPDFPENTPGEEVADLSPEEIQELRCVPEEARWAWVQPCPPQFLSAGDWYKVAPWILHGTLEIPCPYYPEGNPSTCSLCQGKEICSALQARKGWDDIRRDFVEHAVFKMSLSFDREPFKKIRRRLEDLLRKNDAILAEVVADLEAKRCLKVSDLI